MVASKHLMRLDVALGPTLDVGAVPGGHRRVIPIVGGTFAGERLSGTICPGGADWNLVRPDGTVYLWARYTLKCDDGTLIMITNDGYQPGAPDVMEKILTGESIDMTNWYARTRPVFEVTGERYAFLNERAFVGTLHPKNSSAVSIDVHELL
ncbi:hypothetical protein ASE85_10930 [Sphingobium sp. Leaf26]|uniref:DUF3237 domain-containing protein n=1 Tax=Sphingobium sp. Leaf26 TaxID=1735693 RepID=UPI0006F9DE9C|nr:DUF3237 domain-containing protein [Sphingobium sp. Leaf26]KQM99224.1 hypothetical protein ASE85_10930 [Sphingobium sp. Leaf26]